MRKRANLQLAKHEPATVVPATGRLVRVEGDGTVWVEWPDCPGPQLARVARRLVRDMAKAAPGMAVLLVADQDGRPVVSDVIDDRVPVATSEQRPIEAQLDGRRVLLEASERVELRCGKASITLTKNGRVTIHGVEVVTEASGRNRIRGGTVEIN